MTLPTDEENTPTPEELLAQEAAAALARGDVAAEDGTPGDEDDIGAGDEEAVAAAAAAKALEDELDEGKEKPADKSAAATEDDEKKSKAIPLDRHEAILKKERAARTAAEEALKKASKTNADADHDDAVEKQEKVIEELEQVYAKALIDADHKLAASTMSKIRRLDREIGDAKAVRQSAATETRAVESTRYDMLVAKIEAEYPELNPDSDEYDEEIATEVLELKNAFVASGNTPSKALAKAMKYALADEVVVEKDEADPEKAAAAIAKRKADGVEKKAKAAAKTPPNTEKVGLSSEKLGGDGKITAVEIGKLSQAQFAKLSEKDLAEARGDVM